MGKRAAAHTTTPTQAVGSRTATEPSHPYTASALITSASCTADGLLTDTLRPTLFRNLPLMLPVRVTSGCRLSHGPPPLPCSSDLGGSSTNSSTCSCRERDCDVTWTSRCTCCRCFSGLLLLLALPAPTSASASAAAAASSACRSSADLGGCRKGDPRSSTAFLESCVSEEAHRTSGWETARNLDSRFYCEEKRVTP